MYSTIILRGIPLHGNTIACRVYQQRKAISTTNTLRHWRTLCGPLSCTSTPLHLHGRAIFDSLKRKRNLLVFPYFFSVGFPNCTDHCAQWLLFDYVHERCSAEVSQLMSLGWEFKPCSSLWSAESTAACSTSTRWPSSTSKSAQQFKLSARIMAPLKTSTIFRSLCKTQILPFCYC